MEGIENIKELFIMVWTFEKTECVINIPQIEFGKIARDKALV